MTDPAIVTFHCLGYRVGYRSPSCPPTRTGRPRPDAGACVTSGAMSAPRGHASDCDGCGRSAASAQGACWAEGDDDIGRTQSGFHHPTGADTDHPH